MCSFSAAKVYVPFFFRIFAAETIKHDYMYFTLGLTSLPFKQDPKQIIYIESSYNEDINRYIQINYESIRAFFADKNYKFIYLPKLTEELNLEVIRYYAPYFTGTIHEISLKSDYILDYLIHSENRDEIPPSLLYYDKDCLDKDYEEAKCQFRGVAFDEELAYDETDDLSNAYWAIMDDINRHNKRQWACGRLHEDFFNSMRYDPETMDLLKEVQGKIDELKKSGVEIDVLEKMIQTDEKISRLIITKDYRIIIPDYHNMEIEMDPMQKSIYLLFLKHPEGIIFKDLPDYRPELLAIYKEIKAGFFSKSSEKSVETVTNPNKNSMNVYCSRILRDFVSCFDKRLAKYYYIDGTRTGRKRIALPRNLVEWEISK